MPKSELLRVSVFSQNIEIHSQPKELRFPPLIEIGLIKIRREIALASYEDLATGFRINIDDPLLQIFLPDVDPKDRNLPKFTDSLRSLANYIRDNDLASKYIYGLTDPRIASASRRMGFTVAPPKNLAVNGELADQDPAYLVFQSREDFLSRYATA